MTVVVQGANRGLGLAFVHTLLARGHQVIATCRDPAGATALQALGIPVIALDLSDAASLEALEGSVREHTDRVHLLLNVAGLLHGTTPDGRSLQPEKRLEHLDLAAMHQVFAVNAFGPALVTKHLFPLLQHDERAVVANLSARVGSIGDNHLGGWYTYRASKAAQNQLTRTLAIELGRRAPHAIVVALHPGTVDTGLSRPFQRGVPPEKLFTPERAVDQLLQVIEGLKPTDSGGFFAWDGSPIEW